MKLFAMLAILLSSCTYTSYIQVTPPKYPVPTGSKEFIVNASIDEVLNAMKRENLLYAKSENGYQTEEFLIDSGTRAKFSVLEFEGIIKVIPYWGITDEVRSNMALAAGYGAAMISTNEMKRISYNISQTRPKMVFDYAVQVFTMAGKLSYK